MINFYDKMDKSLLPKDHNPQFDKHHIKLPFRMLIVGNSGSMKTNTFVNILCDMEKTFQNIYIVTKNADEPLYNMMKEKLKNDFHIFEGITKIPDIDKMDKEETNLLVFDDLVCESAKSQRVICEAFTRARKRNCSLCYISQNYFDTPRMIRKNLTYLVIKQLSGLQDLFRILREYSLGDKEELLQIYQFCTRDKPDFLLVDLEAPPERKFRFNYNVI